MTRKELDYETASKYLDYEPESGDFYWKERPSNCVHIGDKAGCLHPNGYIYITFKRTGIPAHRIAWLLSNGEYPINQIDHINHNGADNRSINLRDVNRYENGLNKKRYKNNTSGIAGVVFNKVGRKWQAKIDMHGKRKFLVWTDDFFEACCARKSAERKYGFHPNHGRMQNNG